MKQLTVKFTMSNDDQIDFLLGQIETRRKEIESLSKPQWQTSKTFSYNENDNNMNTNIATLPVDKLVKIIAWCTITANSIKETLRDLDLDIEVKHQSHTYEAWVHDAKLAIQVKQISEKKAKLDSLEASLNTLVSPETRRQKELERIMKELK